MSEDKKLIKLLKETFALCFSDEGDGHYFDVDEESEFQETTFGNNKASIQSSISYGYPGYDPEVNFIFNVLATKRTTGEQSFVTSKLFFISDEKHNFARVSVKKGSVEHFHETLQLVTGRKITLG